eukprot:TRINITY_DN4025_c0_g1_i3.p3 TRINITY_DN4025_c0_g1~~TRINITY_DN4025_c0_g1_i3.p3  ORF type:complete len:125 (+),score=12.92 TRINITY_DN4025_c0_g1_i3:1007-1381(+)
MHCSWRCAGQRGLGVHTAHSCTRVNHLVLQTVPTILSERLCYRVRCARLQDMGWFDEHPAGQLPTLVTNRLATIADGIGSKIPIAIMNGFSCIGLFIVAFWQDPQLAAILLGTWVCRHCAALGT